MGQHPFNRMNANVPFTQHNFFGDQVTSTLGTQFTDIRAR